MPEEKDTNWGGARPGAGRPTDDENDGPLSHLVAVKITDRLRERAEALAKDGESKPALWRRLMRAGVAASETNLSDT